MHLPVGCLTTSTGGVFFLPKSFDYVNDKMTSGIIMHFFFFNATLLKWNIT